MKLWDIVKTVGGQVIKNTVPGGGMIVDALNAILPDGKKLPADATGDHINEVIQGLPPEDRAAILDKEFDVELTEIKETGSTLRTMLESDAKNPHSTRPKIALRCFNISAAISVAVVSLWCYAVATGDADLVKTVMGGWPFVAALLSPFVTVLLRYFGDLKSEHKTRLDAAGGSTKPSGIGSLISAFIKR